MLSSYSVAAIASSIAFTCLAIIAMTVRQRAQILIKKPHTIDGALYFGALVIAIGHCAMIVYGCVLAGIGWPLMELLPVVLYFQEIIMASQILWCLSITFVRLGLLFFYKRVFPTPKFRLAVNILSVFTVCWAISYIVGTLASDRVHQTIQPINYGAFLLANSILNLAQDVATLCLPLPVIKSLHISPKRKIAVAGIFLLGFFSVIASCVRTYYFAHLLNISPLDQTFSATTVYCTIWSVIEPCNSLVAACLPACAPLLRKEHRGVPTMIRSMLSLVSLRSKSDSRTPSKDLTNGETANASWRDNSKISKTSNTNVRDIESRSDNYELITHD